MKYYLFLDECGDQNLSNFNPDFDVIKNKIYAQRGKMHGLKIHPSEIVEVEKKNKDKKKSY